MGAVRMPATALTLPASTTLPATGAAPITWTAAGGNVAIIVFVDQATSSTVAACSVHDDGSFPVPASIASAIPAGSGTLFIFAGNVSFLPIGPRTMEFDGFVGAFGAY